MIAGADRPGHRFTTRHAQAIYPFTTAAGSGGRGAYIGRDASGGAFCFDPWVEYEHGLIDDPNALVLGALGQGKSSLVKTLLWRMLLFGRRAFVLDVKHEYGPLCEALGVAPISLVPGAGVRLNPLASRPEERAQVELLRAVTSTAIGDQVDQAEAAALREALRTIRAGSRSEPTLPEVAHILFSPTAEMADHLHTSATRLAADVRRAALALQDLCEGPLRGMFDGPTSPGLALDGRLVVLDLHAVRDSPALGILMACATAWMSALLERMSAHAGRERLINVADESWKIIQHPGLGEWFQSNFKLARQFGVMNLVVLHKLGDLRTAGDAGSRAARIAEGLIADASTRVIYRQDASQIATTQQLLGLSDTEARLLSLLSPGQALWRLGARSYIVHHYRSRIEARFTDTDTGMRIHADEASPSSRPGGSPTDDAAALALIGGLTAVIAGVWVWGGLAGLLFGDGWPRESIGAAVFTTLAVPGHLGNPADAWPPNARPLLPGALGLLRRGRPGAALGCRRDLGGAPLRLLVPQRHSRRDCRRSLGIDAGAVSVAFAAVDPGCRSTCPGSIPRPDPFGRAPTCADRVRPAAIGEVGRARHRPRCWNGRGR